MALIHWLGKEADHCSGLEGREEVLQEGEPNILAELLEKVKIWKG